MKTIFQIMELGGSSTDAASIRALIYSEFERCIAESDLLGAGEWCCSMLDHCEDPEELDGLMAKTIALWSSPLGLPLSPSNLSDLISALDQFNRRDVALSMVALVARSSGLGTRVVLLNDLAYRVNKELRVIFAVDAERPTEILSQAATNLDRMFGQAINSLAAFRTAHCSTARVAAIELIKKTRALRPLSVVREGPVLSRVEMLLGGAFRDFCTSFERGDTQKTASRLNEIRDLAKWINGDTFGSSVLWHRIVEPAADHLRSLTAEASKTCTLALAPSLKLANNTIKVDLSAPSAHRITAMLLNEGIGAASKIRLNTSPSAVQISLAEPDERFDLGAGSEQLVIFECLVSSSAPLQFATITWVCEDVAGHQRSFPLSLRFEQQKDQPDWAGILERPPYSVNPIETRDNLFGREAQLTDLMMNCAAGTSTFVWGQKRVGKTSLLQVLQRELSSRKFMVCKYLRMGELAAMHEGQLAHTIATRIAEQLPPNTINIPAESAFGAGLGHLIPVIESLRLAAPEWRFVVVIDEFDDLDQALYTGERGRLFVKALRSLSEIGLTLLFAGSERMTIIYAKHAPELNKWTNMYLDSISSFTDCHDLITKPLKGIIEYEHDCVKSIVDYCGDNPFFMHVVCHSLLKKCIVEKRTFISNADFVGELPGFATTLGQTNFAHLWSDNPILDKAENSRFAAENCLVLCCISCLGTLAPSAQSIWEQQDSLGLSGTERLSIREIQAVVDRLRTRRVLTNFQVNGGVGVSLPIFRDWLFRNSELALLPIWRSYVQEKISTAVQLSLTATPNVQLFDSSFCIPEDELLSVSQNLIFCGRQKDVAELRTWLRQFDDDNRIEIAFLLLKRLAEHGYVSSGAREHALGKLVDGINARRREIGNRAWRVIRGRHDNLCISYVDSEVKSGAATAREVSKRLLPGKTGSAREVAAWIKSHAETDPIIVIVDDFAGTGSTLKKGINVWKDELSSTGELDRCLTEGRVLVALLFAFPEVRPEINSIDQRLSYFVSTPMGEEVKAFDFHAGIFDTESEMAFAKEVMLQIGRELIPQAPLGFGDQAALVVFHETIPNNTLPIFWSNGRVNERNWKPVFVRA